MQWIVSLVILTAGGLQLAAAVVIWPLIPADERRRIWTPIVAMVGLVLVCSMVASLGAPTEHWAHLSVIALDVALLSGVVLFGARTFRHYYGSMRAVTERLAESEERLARIVETVPEGIRIVNREGMITFANAAAEEILGLRRSEIVGRTYDDPKWKITSVDGGPFPDEQLPFQRVMKTGEALHGVEHAIEHPDGRRVILSINAAPLRDAAGEVIGMVAALSDITERKRAEEALRQAEQQYRNLVEKSLAGVYVIQDGKFVYANPSFAEMSGYTQEELFALPSVLEVVVEEYRAQVAENMRMRLEGEVAAGRYACQGKRKDGTLVDIELLAALTEYRGRAAIIGTALDITERRQAEQLLRVQRDLALAVDRARDLNEALRLCMEVAIRISGMDCGAVYLVDETSGAVDLAAHCGLSDDFARWISHVDPHQPYARLVAVGVPTYTRLEEMGDPLHENNLREGLHALAVVPIHHEGRVVACLNVASRVLDEVPVFARSALETIAAQIARAIVHFRAQDALRESQQTALALLNAPTDIAMLLDTQGTILAINRAGARSFGKSAREAVGRNVFSLLPPQLAEERSARVDEVTRSGKPLRFEGEREGKVFSNTIYPVPDAHGDITRIAVYARDITERKRAEEEIHRLTQELEQRVAERTAQLEDVNQELESFSYSVSHDLRGPLRAIDGYSRVLQEDHSAGLDGEAKRLLNVIRRSTIGMARLIDDLLAFSRLSRRELQKSSINMTAMAQSVVEEHRKQAPERSVDVAIGELPPARGDNKMIRQLFENLISNALKFTRYQPEARIEIGSHVEGRETVYYVKDNGAGFDMQYVTKLFRVFERLHGMEQFDGTGVGLAIVKRIVEKHGGRVWAEGEVDKGAALYFTLPGTRRQRHEPR